MKNTRKAAAVWLVMSLAISTAFGNTAWGEIRPDTENNRCVHVHTAECYKDADKTATPSQIGKEPTECTHICSVESGCIRDTEKENNENADTLDAVASNTGEDDSKKEQAGEKAADRKDSSGNADENKNLNDVPAQNEAALSVSTPSNAKDTTATGGTVTQVSQTKILSWSWFDPEENLLDGRLELTGITEEAQPSFTEIIEYLPSAIIARVEEGKDGENVEDGEEKNLPITNWSCPEYVQDEEGRWPLEGTYEFKAELEEGYELAEGVDALVVEVSVVGDQTAVIDDGWDVLRVSPASGEDSITLKFNGTDFWSYNNGFNNIKNRTNITVDSLGQGNDGQYKFRLTLNDTSASNITIASGDWEIVLNGNNQLDGKGKSCGGIGLYITGWGTHATIVAGTGDASLTANGNQTSGSGDGSCGIKVEANLTVQSGNVVAVMKATGKFNDASGAICVTGNGTLNINGGSVTAKGNGKYGLYATGTINMSEGNFEITGENKIAVDHEPNSNFTLAGGTINITSPTGHTGLSTKGNLTIKGGSMKVNILEIVNNTTMTVEGGRLETGGIKIGDNGKLINRGELIANGNFEGNGTIVNTGTISGSGNVPEGNRTDPGKITFTHPAEVPYNDGLVLNVKACANIKKPENAGALTYEILNESTGKGTIDTNGLLTVKKIGTFVIQVTTEGTGVYTPAKPVTITLKVTPGTFPTGWDLKVEAAKGVYNGAKGYPAATITTTNIPADAKYEYQLAATQDSKQLSNQWLSECPKIINVTFDQYVFVKVITDNYESKVFRSKDPINIERREFTKDNVAVTVNPQTVVYNGKVRNSEIKVEAFENWSDSSGNKVDSADYTILGWTDRDGNPVKELKDAGTYIVRLMGAKRNYWEGVMDASFTIEKCKLKSQMTGGPVDKVYDGTTDITEEQGVFVELWNDSGVPDLQDIHADQVQYAYRSADVGEHYIDATIITLAGDKVNNYELINETSSLKGVIKPRDFASMTVSAAPLTYNGTEQQPKINASVETGLENVSPDATFTYSKDGVNYQSEIPGFTEAGTYLVYVKASMANFNDAVKTVAVTVTPKESSSGGNSGNNSGNNTSGGSGSNSGSSGSGSSSSDGGSSDYDDPNESSVKVTPDPSNKVTRDSQKGYRNVEQGVITGASNQTVNDGYSHWMKDAKGWWLRFSDGTWPMADRTGAYHWEKINGKWWAFDEMGYAKTGWLRDENYGGWFYMDPEHGMQTGWVLLNGVWYYFNPISDGKRGIMYAGQRTPDGYYVDKNGVWDGRNKQ
ncbi:Autolysin [uncultured Clostridium sp.]|nr:Autolysin [uncultured Clostridium sp.]